MYLRFCPLTLSTIAFLKTSRPLSQLCRRYMKKIHDAACDFSLCSLWLWRRNWLFFLVQQVVSKVQAIRWITRLRALHCPKPETTLSYSFTKDGQTEGVMTMNFTPLSGEFIIAGLEEETGNEAVVQVINDLINYGITEFYVSEDIMTNVEGTQEDGSICCRLTAVYTKSPVPTLLVANTSQR